MIKMAGYAFDYSRSNNSASAIKGFEAPLSMFNRAFINAGVDYFEFTAEEAKQLKATPVKTWKAVAKQIGADSWHHTSSHYNRTDHYSVESVGRAILDGVKVEEEKKDNGVKYGVVKVQVWAGTRNHPRLVGTEVHAGTIKGEWLTNAAGKRFKTTANKTLEVKTAATMRKAVALAKKMEKESK